MSDDANKPKAVVIYNKGPVVQDVKPWQLPIMDEVIRISKPILYADESIAPGSFYLQFVLITASSELAKHPTHYHDDADEYIGFIGTNPDDPEDLGGEVDVYLDGEKHTITKACAIYIPRGVTHCPVVFRQIGRPILHFSTMRRGIPGEIFVDNAEG